MSEGSNLSDDRSSSAAVESSLSSLSFPSVTSSIEFLEGGDGAVGLAEGCLSVRRDALVPAQYPKDTEAASSAA